MLLKYVYDDRLAQASYFIGCPGGGVAMVIDPARDITPYLQLEKETGLKIIGAAETHIHADFVSGGRELAAVTGATLYLSAMGEGALAYDFAQVAETGVSVVYVREGDTLHIGDVRLDVLYTPGHTPEHISFQVTDTGADSPIGLFTGDCLFVGDVGRPDLLDATGNAVGTSEGGARQQYENVQRLKAMPDYLQVWPGHGAGSACGKALGAVPSTTIGYEKRFNPAFQQPNPEAFVTWLLDGQPEPPRYFAQMKRVNRVGADLLHTLHDPARLGEETLLAAVKEMDALVIDTRPADKFAAGHVRGTLNIPAANQQFSTWVGWFVDYERPTYLVASQSEITHLLKVLRGIGVDEILGYFTLDIVEKYQWQIEQIAPETAYQQQQEGAMILDVRGASEREETHIPGSVFIPLGRVTEKMNELPHERTIITQCGSGVRSQIIASLLEGRGYHVLNLEGGMEAWQKAGLPQEQG